MTIQIPLTPEVESKLRLKAQAAGKDLATWVRETLEEKLSIKDSGPFTSVTIQQWEAEFNAWTSSHPAVSHFVDDSRDSIYAGRDR